MMTFDIGWNDWPPYKRDWLGNVIGTVTCTEIGHPSRVYCWDSVTGKMADISAKQAAIDDIKSQPFF